MGQSYTLPERVKRRIIWIKLTFSSSLKTSSLLETPLLLETSPSSSGTFSLLLRTLPKDILLIIFRMLDMISMTEVEITCKYFKLIWESVPEPGMYMYPIVPKNVVVGWQWLYGFRYALKYIFQDLKLQSLSEFELVVPEGKAESSPEYSTKALLVPNKNLGNDELQLLQSFISKYPQTPILFCGKDPRLFKISSELCQSLKKLGSLKYLCINDGCLDDDWSNFFNRFKQLKLVYFTPREEYCVQTIWTINTPETVFIMDFIAIESLSGTLE
jgi:hypothetical protein